MKTREEHREYWQALLATYRDQEAEVSVTDFCKQHRVSRQTFYLWRGKLPRVVIDPQVPRASDLVEAAQRPAIFWMRHIVTWMQQASVTGRVSCESYCATNALDVEAFIGWHRRLATDTSGVFSEFWAPHVSAAKNSGDAARYCEWVGVPESELDYWAHRQVSTSACQA